MCVRFGPVVLVEARSIHQRFLVLIENESFVRRINLQEVIWNCKILFSNSKEPTHLYYDIFYFSAAQVEHNVFNRSKPFFSVIINFVSDDRRRSQKSQWSIGFGSLMVFARKIVLLKLIHNITFCGNDGKSGTTCL